MNFGWGYQDKQKLEMDNFITRLEMSNTENEKISILLDIIKQLHSRILMLEDSANCNQVHRNFGGGMGGI